MVLGLGIDLCTVARMQKQLDALGRGFLETVFTAAEIAHGEGRPHPAEHFAARFAAKEATLKALAGGKASGSFWLDIEVARRRRTARRGWCSMAGPGRSPTTSAYAGCTSPSRMIGTSPRRP